MRLENVPIEADSSSSMSHVPTQLPQWWKATLLWDWQGRDPLLQSFGPHPTAGLPFSNRDTLILQEEVSAESWMFFYGLSQRHLTGSSSSVALSGNALLLQSKAVFISPGRLLT